ncbi:alpha-2,8-sialyltransferase 8F-like [Sceloporus undulatus]|uniref:alpha-2,8-sialyltransferase 8F-like n=1 Tax=Sceloporus undulatus TaxID=8520 RepID=UPI001C4C0478|nr:alpha-2,8-sialyltransferase 8F-like [Sceloporus undulatus]XP_042328974.1 alpha-2,8-sialyltransferase 8F-like [Sceloporus undulatus]XP_042328975.1 alpha-2,8-sialyltransferase 8F-like [Sceloporus undulatus]XP_042328978.1 alpha-2,8-sialyltransferase 8F-like [Sceloporus undulatus]XP_042328979.1 alpha-2,8-sialyltransferase 8F-like [Sceloporus undulatus]XP_042328980.1 alpha-2,8-sialyltransferase 8F-like [Sceloporus undulatus]XP_042328981.1 alpha-2,8-sialyltransferase 8F-like [Sceloporus undulatu
MASYQILKWCFYLACLVHFVILFRHVRFHWKTGYWHWKNELSRQDKIRLKHLLLTRRYPWEPNAIEVARYRAELEQCCNASFQLVLTKENTPLGSNISCLEDNIKIAVEAELIKLLPETSPFSQSQYKNCAVVGNGGTLRNSNCGHEIDQADLVVRFNLPPMNFSEDVGTKTSLITINPSILKNKFHHLLAEQKPFADALGLYRDALIFLPIFTHSHNSDVGYRVMHTIERFGLAQKAFFLNPQYQANLKNYWRNKNLQPNRLSSGFIFLSMALEFCQRITLYGFWPFLHDLNNQPIPHHYYDNKLPDDNVHDMPIEFSLYLHMYAQNVLLLQYGKCQ